MKLKKVLSLFILSAIMLSFFTACAGEEVALLSFMPEDEEVIDYGGKEVKIVGYWRDGVLEISPVRIESQYGDMLLDHYDAIGKKFNIKINHSDVFSSNNFILNASTGEYYADIIDNSLGNLIDLYNSGLVMNVLNIIDYPELHSGKYGTESQLGAVTVRKPTGNETYGFIAAHWGIPTPKFSNACYFNPDFVESFELPNPYELLENDSWTWDVFSDMCIAVQTQGADPTTEDDDTYGIAEDPEQNYVARAAFASNDADLVKYDETAGKYLFSLSGPNVSETLEWLRNLYEKGGLRTVSGWKTTTIGNAVNNFIEGRVLFMVEHTYHGTTDKESLSYNAGFDFSWIPFPKGPSGVNYNYNASISNNDRFFFMPSIGTEESCLRNIVPSLFSAFEGLEGYDWREFYSVGMFFNEESEKWFFHMYDNVENNYDFATGFFDSGYTFSAIKGSKSIAEAIQSFMPYGQSKIDKYLNQ